ncbi:MAG TPA: pilus assembly protein PilS, partial [Psychrobacter sp.]|nr:pilus assembly protein PilS [Psychrobacter sp.]
YVQFVITTKVQSETAVPVEGADGAIVPGGEL